MNQLSASKRLQILKWLVEGASIRSIERNEFGHRDTILRLLVRVGHACEDFLDMQMRDLPRERWELDEMWTFCRKKEKRLTAEEAASNLWGDQYLFLAVGQRTKLIPAFLIGKRTEANASRFVRDLAGRLRPYPVQRPRLSTGSPPVRSKVSSKHHRSRHNHNLSRCHPPLPNQCRSVVARLRMV